MILRVRFTFEVVGARHFILVGLPELRLRGGVLSVLVLEVADLFVHLPQLVLKLLNVLLAIVNVVIQALEFLVGLHQHLLLVLRLEFVQIDVVLVLARLILQLTVLGVDLDQIHSEFVEVLHLLLIDSLLLGAILLDGVDFLFGLLDLVVGLAKLLSQGLSNLGKTVCLRLQLRQVLHLVNLVIFDIQILGSNLIKLTNELLHNLDSLTKLLAARVVILVFVLLK